VLLDEAAECEGCVPSSLFYAAIEHLQPVGCGLFEARGAEEIAGLYDDLQRIAEVVREPAEFECDVFRNGGCGVYRRRVVHVGGLPWASSIATLVMTAEIDLELHRLRFAIGISARNIASCLTAGRCFERLRTLLLRSRKS